MAETQQPIMTEEQTRAEVNAILNPFAQELGQQTVFAPDPPVTQPPVTVPPIVETSMGKIIIDTPPITPITTDNTTLDNLYKQMSENLGIQVKSVDDIKSHLTGVNTKLSEAETKLKEALPYKTLVEGLPVEIKNPLIDYAEGKDYKATLKQFANLTDIDITKDAKEIPHEVLIKHFNPDITDEELTAMEDVDKNRLLNSATQLYNVQRQQILQREQIAFEQQETRKKTQISAIEKSVAKLKSTFPDMPDKSINQIRDTLLNGVAPVLVDEKGIYKEEAGERLAMGLYGISTLNEYKSKAATEYQALVQAEVQKERELILKAQNNDTLINRGGGAGGTQVNIDEEVNKQLSFLKTDNSSQFKNKIKPKE